MHHLEVILPNLVFIIFNVLWDMDESNSMFQMPKTLNEQGSVLWILFWNTPFTRTNGHYRFFRQWQDQRMCKICCTEPGGLFKGEDIGKDVQELTESIENMNVKSWSHYKFHELQ